MAVARNAAIAERQGRALCGRQTQHCRLGRGGCLAPVCVPTRHYAQLTVQQLALGLQHLLRIAVAAVV